MNSNAIKDNSQKILALTFFFGFIVGTAAVIYLFTIPADPKNSIIFGFSLFRLIEGGGLGVIGLSCLFAGIKLWQSPELVHKVITFLGWNVKSPWSLAVFWLEILFCIYAIFFFKDLYPVYIPVIERLHPFLFSALAVSLAFVFSYFILVKKKQKITAFKFLFVVFIVIGGLVLLFGVFFFPAEFGLLLRQGSLWIILLVFLNLGMAFKQKKNRGVFTSLLISALLFLGSLIGVWTSAVSDLNIITGLLPFNDANGYYHGGRLLAEGMQMHPFSARRPLFPALIGVLLWITGKNLVLTIGLLVIIGGMAIYLSSHELNKSIGSFAAAFFLLGCFLFYRRFIGSTMSEIIGLPLGALGFAFLWVGAVRQKLLPICMGLLVLTLGLFARAGTFFMLPTLVIWSGWIMRGEKKVNWRAVFFSSAVVFVGYGLNTLVFQHFVGDNTTALSNFSYTLYGLVVGGKGWKQYAVDHPDVLNLVEPFFSRAIYQYAWQAFLANPFNAVRGAFRYWGAFFSFEWYGMFGYITGSSLIESIISRVVMAVLSLVGCVVAVKNFKTPPVSMVVAGLAGIIISVPFVPPLDAEIRPYAAALPWLVGLGMLGLIGFIHLARKQTLLFSLKPLEMGASPVLWVFSILLVLVMIPGSIVANDIVHPVKIPSQASCPTAEDVVITFVNTGSYINIHEDTSIPWTFVPDLRYSDFIRSIHDSPVYRLAVKLMPITPGSSFLTTYNWSNDSFENIIAPTDLLDQNQGWVEMCGWRENNPDEYGFFHAETVREIEQ